MKHRRSGGTALAQPDTMDLHTFLKRFVCTSALILMPAAPALAQVQLQAIGGGTRMNETNVFLGGRLAGRVAVLELAAEGGRLRNVLPRGFLDTINRLQQELAPDANITIRLPATYGSGSLRLIGPAGPVKPFLGAGLGIARITPEISSNTGSAAIDAILEANVFGAETKTMATAEAGLRFDLPKISIDVGYRYWRIFADYRELDDLGDLGDDILVHVNSVFVAAGLKF